jgi:hypothetical protein
MPLRPKWWRILAESRRQACVAVDFYNRSGDRRSYHDFVMHMHTAWLYLLHAEYERGKVDCTYRNARGHALKTKDGDRKLWDLERCVKERFAENDPVRANLEFFIGLRNKVEHRYQDALVVVTAGMAHAYVINYEAELVTHFGAEHSLAEELRFPIFVQSLTPEGIEEQRRLRRRLPVATSTYITRFEQNLGAAIKGSERFDYRVMLTPLRGPKTEAVLAVSIVKAEDLTEEKRAEMEKAGKVGTMVVTEKQRDVMHKNAMAPRQAAAAVEELIPFVFKVHHFVAMWKHYRTIRPPRGSTTPEATDPRYCLYDKPFKQYVYTSAYVKKCAQDVDTREKWRAVFGQDPVAKVTSIESRPVKESRSDGSRTA